MNRFFTQIFFWLLFYVPSILLAQEIVSVSELEKPVASIHSLPGVATDSVGLNCDILHYDVQLKPNFETGFLQGCCRISLKPTDPLPKGRLYFHLKDLQVDSVLCDTSQTKFEQKNGILTVQVPAEAKGADTIWVQIDYHGFPQNDGFGGYFSSPQIVYTVGEGLYTQPPSMTRYWMPCVDRPTDKATLALHMWVPPDISVGSNGLQQKTLWSSQNLKEVTWKEDFPIATYLISVGASHFYRFHQVFVTKQGDRIPIEHFVYPADSLKARADVENLPQMMQFFSEKFGPYPFKKYGMLEAPMQGAMEHQTLTTMSDRLYTGDRRYEGVIAHELAHQWWGDCVTLSDWGEIWLNEGFATYSDALYTEYAAGEKAFREKMDQFAFLYFREDEQIGRFPIVNPVKMWGHTVYEKGAWVLHMLRGVVGDASFFRILQTYRANYAYGNATIADFQQIAEKVVGQSLDWFFKEWLFEAGYPTYTFQWKPSPCSGGKAKVEVRIRQIQTLAPVFKMPVTLRFDFGDSTDDQVVWVERAEYDSTFFLARPPRRVMFDPQNVILKKLIDYSEMYPISIFRLENPFPNPFFLQGHLLHVTIQFWIRATGQPVRLSIFNIQGQKVRTLLSGVQPPGFGKAIWKGRNDSGEELASGIYFCVLQQGEARSAKKIILVR